MSYLMVFPDSTQSCPHRHNRNEEFVLNGRLFQVQRLKNSRSHAGNHMSNTDNAAGEKTNKNSVFFCLYVSFWVSVGPGCQVGALTPGKFWLILHKHKQNKRAIKLF